jgi:hypothetical protein
MKISTEEDLNYTERGNQSSTRRHTSLFIIYSKMDWPRKINPGLRGDSARPTA